MCVDAHRHVATYQGSVSLRQQVHIHLLSDTMPTNLASSHTKRRRHWPPPRTTITVSRRKEGSLFSAPRTVLCLCLSLDHIHIFQALRFALREINVGHSSGVTRLHNTLRPRTKPVPVSFVSNSGTRHHRLMTSLAFPASSSHYPLAFHYPSLFIPHTLCVCALWLIREWQGLLPGP